MKEVVGMWTGTETPESWLDRVMGWVVNAIVWTFTVGGLIVASGLILTM